MMTMVGTTQMTNYKLGPKGRKYKKETIHNKRTGLVWVIKENEHGGRCFSVDWDKSMKLREKLTK